jgi:hypothetical protein
MNGTIGVIVMGGGAHVAQILIKACDVTSVHLFLSPFRQVVVDSPANLWSLQMLRRRGDLLLNDFDCKAIMAYLRACGVNGATYSTELVKDNTAFLHTFKLPIA